VGKVKQSDDKILLQFTVLWAGWECDSAAWIMERPNKTRYLLMTNHGSKYEAEIDQLHERIAEYEDVIAQTRKAITLIQGEA
jgi:hypothetical protein